MSDGNHNHPDQVHGDSEVDLEGYALGTIDDAEREEIARQLQDDPELRAELAEIEGLVGQLGHGVAASRPPGELRERVLASAQSETNSPATVTRIGSESRHWRIAAAVLAAMLVVSSVYLFGQVDDRDQQIADLEASLAAVSDESNPSAVVQFTEPMIWHQLDAHDVGNDVRAYFCYTQDGQVGYVILLGMPMESDDVIQVWLNENDVRVSAGMFRPDDEGRGFLFFHTPGDSLKAYTSIGLTFEPPGGSDAPTSAPMITGDLQS